MPSVYLYIPNIIGYFRIIINFIAFAVCYSNKALFAVLYFFSFVLDGVDGWFARKFNQASTFGAVLDMVTDRYSLHCNRPGLVFLILLGLDITSHWFQMYSSFLSGKTSHKDVKHTGNWLLKLYYGYRPFMAFCCVSCEVLYIILFLFADEKSTSLLSACKGLLNQSPIIILVFISTLVGWAVKQVTNVIQMKTAADACVVYDLKRSK
ncbi:putative CDP-diacylglycerol--inositol 3-phosphatidyltransferase 2 [Zea mays]|uniref:CDP-diacylglycerol--inositol 3-phosphatidyltransferase n=1 Tax=Zea mays TaxID=4577 RepID=A0A1D6LQ07_MAIZE|nr:putative CDP-diacylglycerol--inositol 3-phosphatidyltransferase 2 [Zea mays]